MAPAPSACAFCGAAAGVHPLIAGPVAICYPCVARPPAPVLDATRAAPTCTFCKREPGRALAVAGACMCATCWQLCKDIVRENPGGRTP